MGVAVGIDVGVGVGPVPVTPSTGYVISYGLTPDANQYAVSFKYSDTSGAIPYTINSLNTNTKYYFNVRGMNGCKPGGWSAIKFGDTKSVIKISPQPVPTKTPAVKGARTVLPPKKITTKKDIKVKAGIKKR